MEHKLQNFNIINYSDYECVFTKKTKNRCSKNMRVIKFHIFGQR